MEISERIQFIRKQRGFSQEELARFLSVSFPTVNAWERGKSQPYPRHRKAIEDLYKEVMAESDEPTVLIVEDDESSAILLADYVGMALPTWRIITVDNGYEAILKIGLIKPKIVLLDIMMPEIDGLKVFARVSQMQDLKDTKVIFVTAASDEEVLTRARQAGAFALIQKPIEREELLRTLLAASEQPS